MLNIFNNNGPMTTSEPNLEYISVYDLIEPQLIRRVRKAYETRTDKMDTYDKYEAIFQGSRLRPFRAGTNRYLFEHADHPQIVIKIAADSHGVIANQREIYNASIHNGLTQQYGISEDAIFLIQERIEPCLDKDTFIRNIDGFRELLHDLNQHFLLVDMSLTSKSMTNFGFRRYNDGTYECVACDHGDIIPLVDIQAYGAEIDPNKDINATLRCGYKAPIRKTDPVYYCGGQLVPDENFEFLTCAKCQKTTTFAESYTNFIGELSMHGNNLVDGNGYMVGGATGFTGGDPIQSYSEEALKNFERVRAAKAKQFIAEHTQVDPTIDVPVDIYDIRLPEGEDYDKYYHEPSEDDSPQFHLHWQSYLDYDIDLMELFEALGLDPEDFRIEGVELPVLDSSVKVSIDSSQTSMSNDIRDAINGIELVDEPTNEEVNEDDDDIVVIDEVQEDISNQETDEELDTAMILNMTIFNILSDTKDVVERARSEYEELSNMSRDMFYDTIISENLPNIVDLAVLDTFEYRENAGMQSSFINTYACLYNWVMNGDSIQSKDERNGAKLLLDRFYNMTMDIYVNVLKCINVFQTKNSKPIMSVVGMNKAVLTLLDKHYSELSDAGNCNVDEHCEFVAIHDESLINSKGPSVVLDNDILLGQDDIHRNIVVLDEDGNTLLTINLAEHINALIKYTEWDGKSPRKIVATWTTPDGGKDNTTIDEYYKQSYSE